MSGIKKIMIIFLIFILLFIGNLYIAGAMATQRMWLILDGFCVIISICLLLKYKLPDVNKVGIAFGLSILTALSYLSNVMTNPRSMLLNPIITFVGILAVYSTFDRYHKQALPFIKNGKYQPLITVFIGLSIGILLGTVNLILASQPVTFNFSIYNLLGSFSPAIMEELVMRTLFYALCLHCFKGKLETKGQHLICLFMMVMPHVLIHTPSLFIQMGVIGGMMNTLIYTVLYGLPFALLQKKWDLSSAMLAHGFVDFIRFCFVGLPG
ncbi:MAG: type II CAAX prenyl endopeptidase Rce1 family protein [Beduini sp.]|uniref:CPBP family glutamic-type intramembrane protease n=1 Tax=Beduini sp. TaxID=1922300 RepID=UPI0011CB5944